MTPLAHRFVKQLTGPPTSRELKADVLDRIADAHCFDVTDAAELIAGLGSKLFFEHNEEGRFDPTLAFLPAPKTWIEYMEKGTRRGYLLETPANVLSTAASLSNFETDGDGVKAWSGSSLVLMANDPPCLMAAENDSDEARLDTYATEYFLYAALAVINSPKTIGRTVHEPHRGLGRSLKARGLMFPLRGWTEIKLQVNNPVTSGEFEEGHLSGQKALHFCRAHLRIKMGRLEHVRAHWRGNPALGTKNARYKITP